MGIHIYQVPPIEKGNDVIEKVEAELINSILPPFNSAIPNKEIRNVVNAFVL